MDKLVIEDYDKPYFISYRLKTFEGFTIDARYGALFGSNTRRAADIGVEVRVGDYQLDNTGGEIVFFPFAEGLPTDPAAPIDDNLKALKNALWLSTDKVYKKAIYDFLQRKGKKVYEAEDKKIPSFSREKAESFTGKDIPLSFDKDKWEKRMRHLSRLFEKYPNAMQSRVSLKAEKQINYYVNSEGSRIVEEDVLFNLQAEAMTKAEDGMLLENHRTFYAPSADKLPDMKTLEKELREMTAELIALKNAPVADPYTGPAILEAQAAGVLFHEAVGHRLEGERQDNEDEGRTFKGQTGKRIIPEFLDLLDDPTLESFENISLNGHYAYDDEGVKSRRVSLVEKGILKSFLMSRHPIEGFDKSNGHGRAASTRKPIARMGNTILISHKTSSRERLKEMLIELIKKQKKPYGMIIRDMDGGSTNTSTYGYQAFKGIPRIVLRVFPDGREELVRGVELVGTPLTSINKIVATSDKSAIFNGYCGAESGYVPVSAIAPAVLMKELELQRKKQDKERLPILPSPFNGGK